MSTRSGGSEVGRRYERVATPPVPRVGPECCSGLCLGLPLRVKAVPSRRRAAGPPVGRRRRSTRVIYRRSGFPAVAGMHLAIIEDDRGGSRTILRTERQRTGHLIEAGWLAQVQACRLFAYRFDPAPFRAMMAAATGSLSSPSTRHFPFVAGPAAARAADDRSLSPAVLGVPAGVGRDFGPGVWITEDVLCQPRA